MNTSCNTHPKDAPAWVRYRIHHRTEYQYGESVAICQNQLRMQPISGGKVQCDRSRIRITPPPTHSNEHFDYFGNRVLTFSIEAIHQSLCVEVDSEVVVQRSASASTTSPAWESLLLHAATQRPRPRLDEHRYRSPRIETSPAFADYAKRSFSAGVEILEAALDLTRRIHDDFRYDTTATTVATTTAEAFRLRAGVCQDFAHVEIACLRSLGLPARYVSGYLRTLPPPGQERLVGADESHAWLEVYAGDALGWVGLDPTNACLIGTDHIPVSIGRDYDDISPMRGVILGGGPHALTVSVDVEALECGC